MFDWSSFWDISFVLLVWIIPINIGGFILAYIKIKKDEKEIKEHDRYFEELRERYLAITSELGEAYDNDREIFEQKIKELETENKRLKEENQRIKQNKR